MVGAAATGAQLADEIQRSGRPVTLAVGEHVRACRTYRGRDMQWWMDATGLNDERYDEVENLTRARSLPSFQLAGYPDRRNIDLNALTPLAFLEVAALITPIISLTLLAYAYAADRARRLVASPRAMRWINRTTGGVMAGAAAAIATRS